MDETEQNVQILDLFFRTLAVNSVSDFFLDGYTDGQAEGQTPPTHIHTYTHTHVRVRTHKTNLNHKPNPKVYDTHSNNKVPVNQTNHNQTSKNINPNQTEPKQADQTRTK